MCVRGAQVATVDTDSFIFDRELPVHAGIISGTQATSFKVFNFYAGSATDYPGTFSKCYPLNDLTWYYSAPPMNVTITSHTAVISNHPQTVILYATGLTPNTLCTINTKYLGTGWFCTIFSSLLIIF